MHASRNPPLVLLLVILGVAGAAAAAGNSDHDGPSVGGGARKLLQYRSGWYNRNRGYYAERQFQRNSASIVNTQYAIRSAVESGANPYTTRAATYYGQDQAQLAASRWGNWGWAPYSYGWGRR